MLSETVPCYPSEPQVQTLIFCPECKCQDIEYFIKLAGGRYLCPYCKIVCEEETI